MRVGPPIINPGSTYASQFAPPILVGQARKPVYDGPTSLFVYDNFSIHKT